MDNFLEKFLKDKMLLRHILVALVLVSITLVIYFPTFNSVPLWDDWNFIFKSRTLTKQAWPWDYWLWGDHRRSWPMFYSTISLMYKWWGVKYFNYHLASALVHALNSILIYNILKKMKGKHAFLISVLVLVHPLQFFTVIWIIQFKTLMSIFFFLVSYRLFLEYETNELETKQYSKIYYFSVLFFALSLFSKSSLAPVVLLLLFYKNKKKIMPYILLCCYSIILTLWSTHIKTNADKIASFSDFFISSATAQVNATSPAFFPRQNSRPLEVIAKEFQDPFKGFQLTLNNLKRYSIFLIYPVDNLLVQPATKVNRSLREIILAAIFLTGILLLLIYYRNQKNNYSFWGLCFFLVTLIPFSGLVRIPIFTFSDFVEYWLSVPVLGLVLCLSFTEIKFKKYILVIFIALFSAKTYTQVRKTPEPISIINASIERSPKKPEIKMILAKHYFLIGQYAQSNKVINNVKKTSMMDRVFLQKEIDENVKGMLGQKVDDGAL